jgi:methylglutaconyl-CoA hydratase
MNFTAIAYEVSPRGVATITINRPDRGNALNHAAIDELGERFVFCAMAKGVRVIVLRGAGKHFCAGADMGGRMSDVSASKFTLATLMEAVDLCPKPTIAAVQGAAVGGGLALASACDVVVATPEAFFSIPEVRLGMAPSPVLSALFMRATGYRHFRRYGFSGERFSAARALEMGFVSEVHDAANVDAAVDAIADAMLHGAPGAIAELKSRIADFGVPTAARLYAPASRDAKHERGPEAEEGVAAFREKRNPSWYKAV